jgi:RNA polymerase sigma-70 factor (ECF subfamily)
MKAASVPEATGYDPARLIAAHQAGVWRYLRVLGCESNLADDLTQETFLAVLQARFFEVSPTATAAYLRKTAHNLFVSYQRRARRVVSMAEIDSIDGEWTRWVGDDNGEVLLEALKGCFEELNAKAKLALAMRFREDESRANIAAALRMTEHGAKNLMQRAKQRLRACIESKLK